VLGIDGVGYGFIYTNQHMPTDGAGVSSLDALKKYALFIKWDGNSMGERKVAASVSPSRLATFSAAVGVAYELYPALLAGVEKFRHSVYVVYAGGDDAVLAGDLAALEYVGRVVEYGEAWGFKTAVGVKAEHFDYPVYYAFTDAEEHLEKAKDIDRRRSLVVYSAYPSVLYIEAGLLKERLRHIWGLLAGGEVGDVEGRSRLDRLARFTYLKLLEIYRALELCNTDRVEARRRAAKALVEYVYFVNRRGQRDDLRWIEELTGMDLKPENLHRTFAAALTCGNYHRLGEALSAALVVLNLFHLASRSSEG
jgi:CRISPR-associated protein Csm1